MKIKLVKFLFFLFIVIMPIRVHAVLENESCDFNGSGRVIDLEVNQEIINLEQLKKDGFDLKKLKYKIYDLNDTLLAETTSDADGKVVFKCFVIPYDYTLYKIKVEQDSTLPFDYDKSTMYVSTGYEGYNESYKTIIAVSFYKDDNTNDVTRYDMNYKNRIFHASESALQGQAYAVIDKETNVMTFFRDTPNKYTNKQEIGQKIYFTGFEEFEIIGTVRSWSDGWEYKTNYTNHVKKIVFKDAVKPNSIVGWFNGFKELEEVDISKLDTSKITSLDYFFLDCPKLKNLDISTMDVSKVDSMFKAFNNIGIKYLDLTRLNLDSSLTRVQIGELIQRMPNLKYLNISNLGNWSSSAEIYNLPCLEKIILNDTYDFYRGNLDREGPDAWYSIDKNKIFTFNQIRDNLYYKTESMAGEYIRPTCNSTASFTNVYNHQVEYYSIMLEDASETIKFTSDITDLREVEYRSRVTFRLVPKAGYILKSINITDVNGTKIDYSSTENNNEYSFLMPESNVIIDPIYEQAGSIVTPEVTTTTTKKAITPGEIKNPATGDNTLLYVLPISVCVVSFAIGIYLLYKGESK